MKTKPIEVPEEILDILHGSHLGRRSESDQVRTALAIHLFLEGLISIGKAAALAGEARVEIEWRLVEMGLPTVALKDENSAGASVAARKVSMSAYHPSSQARTYSSPGANSMTGWPPKASGLRAWSVTCITMCPRALEMVLMLRVSTE